MTLNERLAQAETKIKDLQSQIDGFKIDKTDKGISPTTISGGIRDRSLIRPIDPSTGRGQQFGGAVIWNNTEIDTPLKHEPDQPTVGYNKHSHSRYSGGALIKDCLEIVEYDWDNVYPSIDNKHSQQFWVNQPKIKTEVNTQKKTVDKIGLLDLVFNPSTKTWGTPAYEIDVKKCYLVERDANGIIVVDSKGREMKSPLYNTDPTKTSIVWDENGNCWRLYAAYAPGV